MLWWLVRFNNGLEIECSSITLKILGPVTLASIATTAAVLPFYDALATVALAQTALSAPAASAHSAPAPVLT
jgi:hypothetical protein